MKRLVILVMLTVCSVSIFAQTRKGDSSFGANVGYGFDTENVTLGVDYRYNVTNEIRITPSITHFVKHDYRSAWAIDLNAHYVVQVSENFGFYPLGGLSLSFWKLGDKHTVNRNRLGANIGLGAEVYASRELTVGVEFKYHIIDDWDQAMFAVRAAYNF